MSVVGFDIGNENCVIGVAKQRGIDVLLNDESNRENPAVVSFGENQRFIGSAGAASATTHPRSTISQVKRLIGKKFKDSNVQYDITLLPFETSEAQDGSILIHLTYMNKKTTFTPVQILAMLLSHLKQISEKNLETNVSDCVIGIPSYFTDLQRRLYLHAADIAGLKPLRLIHDCSATALGYGIYKNDFQNGASINVIFVDVGQCDTQVCVASFEPGRMKILSHTFDSNLGGRDFDEVLFKYFSSQFKQQYNIDVYSNARACVRLRSACEKLKKVLSANPEAPINIECLMDEKDVKGFIKREDFEKLSSQLLERFSVPCHKGLVDSGLTVDKIHTVELVGSGSRIPAITKILASIFKKEPRRSLNASECVARGCALQCAMLSPTFRVKEYEVQDSFPFSIGFALEEGPICTLSNGILFPKGHLTPSIKMLTLNKSKTFHVEAFYANLNELPSGTSSQISNFGIGPFHTSNPEKSRVKVRVHLNLHGIITIDSASVLDDHTENHHHNHNQNAKNHHDTHSENDEKQKRKGNIQIKENIYGGMKVSELTQAREQEAELTQQDIKMERTKEKKNSLESYVYETRNKLLNTYRSFASDTEREIISSNLQQTEEWLYEDGDDESEQVYSKKLVDLKKMVDPVENRYKDEEFRAPATRSLLNCIVEYRAAAANLPGNERDAVLNECFKAEQWLREKSQQQDSLPKSADPILLSSDIQRKKDALDAMCRHIWRSKSSSPKPKEGSSGEYRGHKGDMGVD